jgi:hypothetical protein
VDLDLLKYFHFFSQYFCTISGEQCRKSPAKYYRKRQMVECMTRKVLREGRALADLTYEIEMVEMKKAKVESKLMFDTVGGTTVPKNKQLLEQWSSLCKIRMTLLAKQDFSKQTLYSFSFTTPGDQGQAGQHNYGKVCDRELAALTEGKGVCGGESFVGGWGWHLKPF